MPIRSLNSAVIKWPDAQTVDTAVRRWARRMAAEHVEVRRIGYIGSYARGNWGVGSDVDIVVVCSEVSFNPVERARLFDASDLPVPADVLVYTEAELERLRTSGQRIAREIQDTAVWVWPAAAETVDPATM